MKSRIKTTNTSAEVSLISLLFISVLVYSNLLIVIALTFLLLTFLICKYLHKKTNKLKTIFNLKTSNFNTLKDIDNMTGIQFERYVAKLLKTKGYTNIKLTEKYDLGIDIIATKDNIRYGIQVKRYSYPVKADAIRQVVTALNYYNCDKAMVITNSTFTKTAIKLAQSNGCRLITKDYLY